MSSSLGNALGWVGKGGVATVFGRLRSDFRVVDVDLSGDRGDAVTGLVADWARKRGRWHLVRPSGGPLGRHHIFVHIDRAVLSQLKDYIGGLRRSFKVSSSSIDVRTAVRPLSAPHRSGTATQILGGARMLREVLRTCPAAAPTKPGAERRRRHTKVPPTAAGHGPRASWLDGALPSPRKARRVLPVEWAGFLKQGTRPQVGGTDHSGSTFELIVTKKMAAAGYTPAQAWETVLSAHPSAMPKACKNQERWVRYVWNRSVQDLALFLKDQDHAAAMSEPVPDEVLAAVAAARRRLHVLLWDYPARQRDTLACVGHAVLDRMERTGDLRVPVPEWNLVLDTGITSRQSIRAALRFLDGRLGLLHRDVLDPTQAATTSFEFEIKPLQAGAVLKSYQPSNHTPLPWLPLPRTSRRLWQALRQNGPLPLPALCHSAALPAELSTPVSPAVLRTARASLLSLERAGLARCTPEGPWEAIACPTSEHLAEGQSMREDLEHAAAAARSSYRSKQATSWAAQRRDALEKVHTRYKTWWENLTPEERQERQERHGRAFAKMSVRDQEAFKARQARQRISAGVDEANRYRTWWSNLTNQDYLQRSTERAAAFAALPQPLQEATVVSWKRHRRLFGLPAMSLSGNKRTLLLAGDPQA
ncbi:hypothetical protein [Paenarthrobacter histidinolovorans]|uniref:hypothetical protein n=1 Tax=Paenarthrobacter histidinolovorans TaxID=43664 RepID=UPI00384E4A81